MLFTTKLSSLTWSGMFIHSGFPFTIPNTWSLLPLVPLAEIFPLNIKPTTLRLLVLMFSMFPVLTERLLAFKFSMVDVFALKLLMTAFATLRLLVLMLSMFPVLTDKLFTDKLFADKLFADKLF